MNLKKHLFPTLIKHDIQNSYLAHFNSDNVNHLASQYDSVLSTLLDVHAPIISRIVTARPHAPWFTDTLRGDKHVLHHLERA